MTIPLVRAHGTEIVTLTGTRFDFLACCDSDYNPPRTISIFDGLVMDSQGDPMPATSTVSVQTKLLAGDTQEFHFRPGVPGVIGVRSVPSTTNPRSELGFLATFAVRRPGNTTPLAKATYKGHNPSPLILSCNPKAADLAGIDHSGNAARVGLEMNPTELVHNWRNEDLPFAVAPHNSMCAPRFIRSATSALYGLPVATFRSVL